MEWVAKAVTGEGIAPTQEKDAPRALPQVGHLRPRLSLLRRQQEALRLGRRQGDARLRQGDIRSHHAAHEAELCPNGVTR